LAQDPNGENPNLNHNKENLIIKRRILESRIRITNPEFIRSVKQKFQKQFGLSFLIFGFYVNFEETPKK